ncbi:MAG TPA: DUF4097 family beta strand repeat-containing protein [Chthonomonadaceae bacterium]|nr:DUF4097 family beta strand repeat-containing protein [Chthonomonadaceae bacterium]
MDENVMSVLQLLQDGKISAQEAETLIAALRGETAAPKTDKPKEEAKPAEKGRFNPLGDLNIKPPKIDLEHLGERISKAVARVQPEKIVQKVQTQLRNATRASAQWGISVSTRMRHWSEGTDVRPVNPGGLPEQADKHEQDFHLDAGATVYVENPLGNVSVVGIAEGPASVVVQKVVWGERAEDLKMVSEQIEVNLHGTDTKLDIKVSAADFFRNGTVDLELQIPRSALPRVSTHFGSSEISQMDGRVEAVTTAGPLHLHDLGGDARGETASGSLRVERAAGMVTIATQSGDIQAETVGRGLSANSASGDVKATGVEGGRVECKSVSGDVSVETVGTQAPLDITVESVSGSATLRNANGNIAIKAVSGIVTAEDLAATRLQAQTVSGNVQVRLREAFSGTMQVNTVSGNVEIGLPEGSNTRVSLSTASGELHCEHSAENVMATDTLWTGQIGTGAGTLNVQTISGNTRISKG